MKKNNGQLKVVYRKVADLKHFKNNPRTHTDDQIAQIVGSIHEFGFTQPILLDGKNTILAGHGRVMAAEAMGMERVPTIDLHNLSTKQKAAYVIADNKLAENAGWDTDILQQMIPGMDDYLRELIGFSDTEINNLFRKSGLEDEDAETPVPETSRIQTGEVWQLGKHRLLCGDCTVAADLDLLMDGKTANLMVTDPPYGVEYDAHWRSENKNKKKMLKVTGDNQIDWSQAYKLFNGNVAYIWHADRHASEVQRSIEEVGFVIICQLIWAKDRIALSRGDYHWQHEPCWYAVRKGKKHNWTGGRSQSTLWEIPAREDSGHGHSTQKPVECMRRPMLNNSKIGDSVYDPFVGSGTSIIAAESVDRICYAMDINPICCEMSIQRWETLTGGQAVRL